LEQNFIMNKKFVLPYAEFYVTNVCNLTCTGCNRFNNYKFKGWQDWHQVKDSYTIWSQEFDINCYSILGGEPLLNPTFYDWVLGLRQLWPDSILRIASNGTQLERHQQLYDILRKDPKIIFSVCLHNKRTKKELVQKVKDFLVAPFTYDADTTLYREKIIITDANGVSIQIHHNWWFHQGAIRLDSITGQQTLHQSDPEKAHDICHSKTCHHFENGKLYKCGLASLFKQYDEQHQLQLSPEDRQLINSYVPLSITDSTETKQAFLNNLPNSISMCKFCPESYQGQQIFAEEKKVVFAR